MSDTVGGTTGSYGRDTARGCNRNATWRWSRRRARIWKVWRRVSTHKAASRVGRRRVQAVRDPAEIRPCRRGSEPPQFTTGSQPCFSVDSKQGRSAVGVCNWAPARADVWRGVPLGDFPALSIESWEAAVHGPRRGTVVARWWNRRARPFDAPKDACLAGLRRVWCGRHVTRPTNAGKRKERGKPRRCDRRCRGRSSVQKTHGPREPVRGMRSPASSPTLSSSTWPRFIGAASSHLSHVSEGGYVRSCRHVLCHRRDRCTPSRSARLVCRTIRIEASLLLGFTSSSWKPTTKHVSCDGWSPAGSVHFERLKGPRGWCAVSTNAPPSPGSPGDLASRTFRMRAFETPQCPLSSYPTPGPLSISRPFDERSTVLSLCSGCAMATRVSRCRWPLQDGHMAERDAWNEWNTRAEH